MNKHSIILITGGARSGKSRLALELAADHSSKIFIATCEPLDGEMEMRISKHRRERSKGWKTIEEPVEISAELAARREGSVLVDCLTLWISNLMDRYNSDLEIMDRFRELSQVLQAREGQSILVTNEVGLGIVPENAAARRFRDLAGTLNQTIAAIATTVILCVSGLPLYLKDTRKTK